MKPYNSRILFILLFISLGINLAIAGFVGAQWYKHGGPPKSSMGWTFDRHTAIRTLDKSDEKRVKEIWRSNRTELRDNFKKYRKVKRQLSTELSADPLDKDQINDTYKKMIKQRNMIEEIINLTLIDTSEALSPDARVEFFKKGFRRWTHHEHNKRTRLPTDKAN